MAPYVGISPADENDPFEEYEFKVKGNLEEIIKPYITEVTKDFTELKSNIDKVLEHQPIDRIILSGGACIMDWVGPLVKQIFQTSNIILDNQPSYVVARGIALYAVEQRHALDKLKEKIENSDFDSIYKKADLNATIVSIEKLLPSVIAKIEKTPGMNGESMRTVFCDFVKSLNPDNDDFCHFLQEELDKRISSEVGNALKNIIYSTFGISIDVNDINIHIEADALSFNDSEFLPNGAIYKNFENWIKSSSGYGFLFNMSKTRDEGERKRIANGTKSKLLSFLKHGDKVIYSDISLIVKSIKKQAKEKAEALFYEKQLFRTTFVGVRSILQD